MRRNVVLTGLCGVALSATLMAPASAVPVAGQAMPAATTASDSKPQATDDHGTLIVGGEFATEDYPFIAYTGGCGGALIAKRWVVTAAHCLGIKPYKIRVGSLNRWEGGDNMGWSSYTKHPKYGKEAGYDIALIELSSDAKYTPIPLAARAGDVGTRTRILGWGATTPSGKESTSQLKQLDTSIRPASACDGVDGAFNPSFEVCTDNPRGQSACYGDSGSPQIRKVNGRWAVIAVTSRGPDTCATAPTIYTDVPAHFAWINEVTRGAVPRPAGWKPTKPIDEPTTGPTSEPTNEPTSEPTTEPTDEPTTGPTTEPTDKPTTNPGGDTFTNSERQPLRDYQTATSEVRSTYAGARKMTLTLDAEHACAQHLTVHLTTPQGRRVKLKSGSYARRCSAWTRPVSETYDLSIRSEGTWKLEVADGYRGGEGVLKSWSLKFSK